MKLLLLLAMTVNAQTVDLGPRVDLGMMTWVEVKQALAQGKTTALIYNGGTEQRGPQAVNGGHTLMAQATALAIARKLGNAIAAPVLPYSPNTANPALPGTIGITPRLYAEINEQVAGQMIQNGFRNVVLMADHGDGQKELAEVARRLDAKYAPRGVHVVYCGDVYAKANADFNKWAAAQGYPPGTHASLSDTSEMIYLGGDKGWVRLDELKNAVGGPGRNNGIAGDARRSSAAIGQRIFEMRVDYAVEQIHRLLR